MPVRLFGKNTRATFTQRGKNPRKGFIRVSDPWLGVRVTISGFLAEMPADPDGTRTFLATGINRDYAIDCLD